MTNTEPTTSTATATPDDPANVPEPLRYDDPAEERAHRKRRVAIGYRMLARFGLDEGVAGHITARDPERLDHFWTGSFGDYFGKITADDLILVGPDGDIVEGDGRLNRAAFAIHSEVHDARPEIVAAVHAHGLHGKAFSASRRLLAPLTQDACAFFEDHVRFDDYTGVVFDESEGARIATTLGHRKAVILANHGHLTVGTTVDSALWWFLTMERSFQAELLARGMGPVEELDPTIARDTAATVGREDVGCFAFQPIAQRLIDEFPELG